MTIDAALYEALVAYLVKRPWDEANPLLTRLAAAAASVKKAEKPAE